MLPSLHIKWERWKYNKTFEVYVSNMGRIRNSSKALLAPKINEKGYCLIKVNGSTNKTFMSLHRLVMLTWCPTPEAEFLTVDHLDHNKRNNAVENLEWVTEEENLRRAERDFVNTVKEIIAVSFIKGEEETIIRKDNKEDIENFENKYLGKINCLSRQKLNEMLKNCWKGKTKKEKFGFKIKLIYR